MQTPTFQRYLDGISSISEPFSGQYLKVTSMMMMMMMMMIIMNLSASITIKEVGNRSVTLNIKCNFEISN